MSLLTKIEFCDGQEISLNKDSIIVLVGPNNAGKSQSLKDINELCLSKRWSGRTVKSIQFDLPPQEALEKEIATYSTAIKQGSFIQYEGLGYSFTDYQLLKLYQDRSMDDSLGIIRGFLVSFLGTESRLGLVYPPQSVGRYGRKEHPIHYMADSIECQQRVSSVFQQAFGASLVVDLLDGDTMPLRIGALSQVHAYHTNDTIQLLNKARDELAGLDEVQDQGDGIRSFVGIILSFLVRHWHTFIIDEPEAFLHPPQAYVMGHLIGEMLGPDRQCVMATHSKDIVRGLIEACPDRVQIVRITRSKNVNTIRMLDSEAIDELWSDPILKYSDIMDSMFHEAVVLCESDSDCMMYSLIYSYISSEAGHIAQVQFMHCGGKARMAKVVCALGSLGIPFRVVPDLDILNDEQTCRKLFEACGGIWDEVASDFRAAYSSIAQKGQKVRREQLNALLASSSKPFLTQTEIKEIGALLSDGKPWSEVKRGGFSAFPGGNANNAVMRLNKAFQKVGIYMVPVGELEMFNKSSGKHGPVWVAEVLEANPNLGDAVYREIREFVSSWGI